MKHHHRSGLTVIEILVILAIIAILLAILIPAIEDAKKAANEYRERQVKTGVVIQIYSEAPTMKIRIKGAFENQVFERDVEIQDPTEPIKVNDIVELEDPKPDFRPKAKVTGSIIYKPETN